MKWLQIFNGGRTMKLNKKNTNFAIRGMVDKHLRNCTKLELDNIVFPKWSDMGLLGQILAMKVKTKEQPAGCDYDEAAFQVVLRVINGKVLMTGGRPDAYTWKQAKVADLLKEGKVRLIGANSASGVINLSKVLSSIGDHDEQMMFADMFCNINKDMLLVTSPAESRVCVEVTQELYDAGLRACVDSWMVPDKLGEAEATILNVGDFLIVDGGDAYTALDEVVFYCIRRAEFLETYSLD